jgi:hypothetical protein
MKITKKNNNKKNINSFLDNNLILMGIPKKQQQMIKDKIIQRVAKKIIKEEK